MSKKSPRILERIQIHIHARTLDKHRLNLALPGPPPCCLCWPKAVSTWIMDKPSTGKAARTSLNPLPFYPSHFAEHISITWLTSSRQIRCKLALWRPCITANKAGIFEQMEVTMHPKHKWGSQDLLKLSRLLSPCSAVWKKLCFWIQWVQLSSFLSLGRTGNINLALTEMQLFEIKTTLDFHLWAY